jgi:hypothetical protein
MIFVISDSGLGPATTTDAARKKTAAQIGIRTSRAYVQSPVTGEAKLVLVHKDKD